MRILITGANGFIGKNLVAQFHNLNYNYQMAHPGEDVPYVLYEYDLDTNPNLLDVYCEDCDFVYHLAGVNRPKDTSEYMEGNCGFSAALLECLRKNRNTCPVMLSSSVQAALEGRFAGSVYGESKKAAEDMFFSYARETGVSVYVYRFPNVFGKWCKPNYNSAVSTFCYNIAHDLPIRVNDRGTELELVYIDDILDELTGIAEAGWLYSGETSAGHKDENGFYFVPTVYHATLGEIADLLYDFRNSRGLRSVPDMSPDSFSKKLYATYLSYLPQDEFEYPLKMNVDARGSFTEILRTADRGQFAVNISKPGITKGNHWHHTKNEKFVVVSGKALIQLRKVGSEEVIDYHVNGNEIKVVDIPPGYTHNITNEGDTDLVTFMWCNECFDPERPDTFYMPVNVDK